MKQRPVNSSFDSTVVVLGQHVAYFILDTWFTWFGIILLKNVMLFLQNRYLLQNVNIHNIYKLKKGLYKILHCQTTWQYFTFFRSILMSLSLEKGSLCISPYMVEV